MIPRIMLAAPKSGSGKTTITCALIGALKKRGLEVASCKCGPDYIDPMFHRSVLGITACNLDTFFTGEEETVRLLQMTAQNKEIVVMEGVMGLFDGLGGIREEGSSYHLAKVTKTPIILVINVHGMGRSMIPAIQGFLNYDTEHLICGVILNRMTKAFYETMRPVLEQELCVPILGIFEPKKELHLESRHLGLKLPEEVEDLHRQLEMASNLLEQNVDVERILTLAQNAEELALVQPEEPIQENTDRPILAIARDEAFCFYYEENLRLLGKTMDLRYFSPLHDKALPEGTCGIYLGGGYPELYARELSQNETMRAQIKEAVKKGMPSFAECGGFLYLHDIIETADGAFEMAGAVEGKAQNTGKLVRFGYVEIRQHCPDTDSFLGPDGVIKGHEFHYFDSTNNGAACQAAKPVGNRSWDCVHAGENYWWGFPHLYLASNPQFIAHFTEQLQQYKEQGE